MAESHIEWTDSNWNPVTGCTKVSDGCKNCYALRMSKRLKAMGQPNYRNGFTLTMHEHMIDVPLRWKRPQRIFVNSMSDLFHKDVPLEFIQRVFETMLRADWHQYQVLTKRADRLEELSEQLPWANQIWMGTSVENEKVRWRIDSLRNSGAKIKFLSLEPLIGPLRGLDLTGIDWVIVGGESGPGARPIDVAWALDLRDQCVEQGVAFFFKQWGGVQKSKSGRILDGRTWDEYPVVRPSMPEQLELLSTANVVGFR